MKTNGNLKVSVKGSNDTLTIKNFSSDLYIFEFVNGVTGYSKVYLKTLQSQLSAIFNHSIRLYELKENPVRKAGSMGGEKQKEMLAWTKEEYKKIAEAVMDKPQSFYAFEVLYWTGLRVGELLALTPEDIDLEKYTILINKSYQRLQGEDYITDPKTEKSNRTVSIPDFFARNWRNTWLYCTDLRKMTDYFKSQRVICIMR